MTQRYVLISPCRDEAAYMRRTLDSVIAQTRAAGSLGDRRRRLPTRRPEILADYAAATLDPVVASPTAARGRSDRAWSRRSISGSRRSTPTLYDFLCKLDLDLDLPPRYFEILLERMAADPRLGSASGKPYFRNASGRWISEKCGDEMSVGMTKFYRRACFEQIGGFVREVMWDAIDCHKARQLGWTVRSWDGAGPALRASAAHGIEPEGVLTGGCGMVSASTTWAAILLTSWRPACSGWRIRPT
jgi:biofilm PGA synthesis N-glycosyltransferase PgaC